MKRYEVIAHEAGLGEEPIFNPMDMDLFKKCLKELKYKDGE